MAGPDLVNKVLAAHLRDICEGKLGLPDGCVNLAAAIEVLGTARGNDVQGFA